MYTVLEIFTCLALVVHNVFAQEQYPLAYGDASILKGASQECITAFNANVSCANAVGLLFGDMTPNLSQNTLDFLCNGECLNALKSYLEKVGASCASDVTWEDVADSSTWPTTYLADKAMYALDLNCLRRSDGDQFCNQWFQSGAAQSPQPECDACYLETVRKQAISPFENDPTDLQTMYSSLSAGCSYTGGPATPTSPEIIYTSPTATPRCDSRYTIQAGDTPLSVSQSQSVGTHDLLTANGLSTNSTFPTSGTLCIRNRCQTYVVSSGDTCRSIATSQKLALAELYSWNPSINGICSNLGGMLGKTLCITNPLGDFVVGNNTGGAITSPAPVPSNIAPQTNTNCGRYHNVLGGDDCGTIGLKYDISLKDFRFLNPMVWDNCTNLWIDTSYCVTPVGPIEAYPGYSQPTATFSMTPEISTPVPWTDPFSEPSGVVNIPLADGTRNDCWEYLWWNTSLSNPPSCEEATGFFEISMEQFLTWNPSMAIADDNSTTPTAKDGCSIAPSSSYCMGIASPTPQATTTTAPPSPRGAGEIDGCQAWFQARLNCESHLALARLTIDALYKYNPSVGPDCRGFVLGTYYCWSTGDEQDSEPPPSTTGGSPTTTTGRSPTTTAPTGGVVTPTPTQSGMVSGCDKFHKVVSGDGCWAIANDNQISLDDFYAWNPAVGSDCAALLLDFNVCVGRSSASTVGPPSSTRGTSAAPSPTSNLSPNGLCGGTGGKTCKGSGFGDCCSASGYCGSWSDYCGSGCQRSFGTCDESAKLISPNGLCAGTDGYTCAGSVFGGCCSASGYCGSTGDYCGNGCQSTFGTCG
ncbi:hypothetical protein BDZ85DRAFT_236355 [Elsinoe ampelina]|uniref:Carbohydrate-binding module family 18 protein n=1 Tax=Elsinoe ampelina TaxID=302913 RepID=A0A6A6GDQ3_9PEZI|nr:hypothetical protein BDZ85DRAFT_236355 [Elsinoe ampelina]